MSRIMRLGDVYETRGDSLSGRKIVSGAIAPACRVEANLLVIIHRLWLGKGRGARRNALCVFDFSSL